MSITDPAAEEAGPQWTRHNLSDHDDVATAGAKHWAGIYFDGVQGKFVHSAAFTGPPTAAAGANAGTSPPAPVVTTGATDRRGVITFGSGTGSPAAGAQLVVTFHTAGPVGAVPSVRFVPQNAATAALAMYPSAVSNTGFTLSTGGALGTSQAATVYSVEYVVGS